jgi:uncharacterized protein YggT (Ycf19 family)
MRIASAILWLTTATVMVTLGLRFAMRAIGVRGDVPFPALIYSLTAPVVEPFYGYFPTSERFDFKAVEVASLAAAGVVFAAAGVIYLLALLVFGGRSRAPIEE